MIVEELTQWTTDDCEGLVNAELSEELDREYIYGLVGKDSITGKVIAGIIWELKNADDDDMPSEAEILWFYATNAADGKEILKDMEINVTYDNVSRIYFENPSFSAEELEALERAKYTIGKGESRDIVVTVGELAALKLLKKKKPNYIQPLAELTFRKFKAAIMTAVFRKRYGLLEDLPYLPQTRFDQEISCCTMTDDTVTGLLLVHRTLPGPFIVELLFALQPDANVNLFYMICCAVRMAAAMVPESEKVILRRHNKATELLVKKLFPDKMGETVIKGEKMIEV